MAFRIGSDINLKEEVLSSQHSYLSLQGILDSSPSIIGTLKAIKNDENEIVDFEWSFVNKSIVSLEGKVQFYYVGKKLLADNTLLNDPAAFQKFAQVVNNGNPCVFETYYGQSLHPKWYQTTVVKFEDGISVTMNDITEGKEARDKILSKEILLEGTQQIAHIGSWEWDINTNDMKWSDEMYRLFGYQPGEINIDFLKFIAHIHRDDREDIRKIIQNCYQNGDSYFFQKRIIKKDNTLVWVEAKGKVFIDSKNIPVRIAGVLMDITEQKIAEEKLVESERLLEQIADSTPNILYVFNFKTNHPVYFNREIEKVLGYTPEEVRAGGMEIIMSQVSEEDLQKLSHRNWALERLKNNEVIETEFRLKDKTGNWKWINSRETVFKRDSKGRPLEILGVAEDITSKKQINEELRELNEAMQFAVEGIGIVGSNNKILSVNKSQAKLLGYKPKEMIGMDWWEILHPEDKERAKEALSRIVEDKKTTLELRGIRKNGSFFYKELTMVANVSKDNKFKGWYSFIRDITERKKTEQSIIDTKLKFEAVFNQTYQFISLLEIDGKVLDSNKEALTFRNITLENIKGKYFWDLPTWKDKEKLKSAIWEAAKGGFVRTVLEMTADGKLFMVDFSVKPILNEDKKIMFLIAEGRDITERMEAERELLKSKTLLAEAEELAHNGSWELDVLANKLIWSDEMYRIYGVGSKEEEITYDKFLNFIHPENFSEVKGIIEDSIKSKQSFSFEHKIIQPEGGERILLGRGKVLTDEKGKAIKVLGSSLDITDQKEATRQILINEGLYRTLAKNIPNSAVMFFDKSLVLKLADGAAINALGPREELLGKTINEIFGETEESILILTARKVFEGIESTFEKEIADRIYTVDILPVKNLNGDIFSGMLVAHDITDVKKYQEELEMHIEELNRSNTELEQFAYVASHDLQEPLRKIRTFGGRLSEKYAEKLGEDGQNYINRMQNAAHRMQVLIDDLLAFSRLTRSEESFSITNLSNIITEIISDFEITIEQKSAKVRVETLPVIEAMPTQMRQLFQNLISNALKFSKADVSPEIIISSEILHGKDLPSGFKNKTKTGKYCKISFKDNGIGFDDKYADKIFVIFQRLHGRSEYPGTGIGLAVCKKILDNHHGFITASSKLLKGSTFSVYLPMKQHNIEQLTLTI